MKASWPWLGQGVCRTTLSGMVKVYPAPPRPFGTVHAGDVCQFRDTMISMILVMSIISTNTYQAVIIVKGGSELPAKVFLTERTLTDQRCHVLGRV
jgi:hypothetical protein